MEIHQEDIDTFKNAAKRIPKNIRRKWVKTLAKSKQTTDEFASCQEKNCYCVVGALLACQGRLARSNNKYAREQGHDGSAKFARDQLGEDFSVVVALNDSQGVPFSLFRKWINETLPSNV